MVRQKSWNPSYYQCQHGTEKENLSEVKYWMNKYKQDEDEQLQRLRKALPKKLFLVGSSAAKQDHRAGVENES